jgi:hypothetical protein
MDAGPTRARPRWEPIAAALFPVALLLPFLNKAYHIDDPLSLWTARHILDDPLRFFDYTINWTGVDGKAYLIIKNPPLSMFYMALVGAIFGFSEPVIHAAFLLPAALVGFGSYRIALRFCSRPLLAAFATVLTPAVLISASDVMTTLSMLAFYVVALDLWLTGLERKRPAFLFASAAAMTASALTQYFGASLVPLVFVYTLLRLRKAGWWLAALAIPVVALVLYDIGTRRLFGFGMLTEAGTYAQQFRGREAHNPGLKLFIGTLFAGGCVWTALWLAPLFMRRIMLAISLVAGILLGFVAADAVAGSSLRAPDDLTRVSLAFHVGIFLVAGVFVLGLAMYDLYKTRSPESVLLLLWVLGTFAFASIVNWTANGRSLLGMCPPAAILTVRAMDRAGVWGDRRGRVAWATLVPMGALCLALVYADYRLAGSARAAARYMFDELPIGAGRRIYLGHWGFQYYMQQGESEHFDLRGTDVGPGDAIILPTNNMRQMEIPEVYGHTLGAAFPVASWLSTFDFRTGAGFYASAWGPLPYAFGPVPDETYAVLLVDRTARLHDPRLDPETGLPVDP